MWQILEENWSFAVLLRRPTKLHKGQNFKMAKECGNVIVNKGRFFFFWEGGGGGGGSGMCVR